MGKQKSASCRPKQPRRMGPMPHPERLRHIADCWTSEAYSIRGKWADEGVAMAVERLRDDSAVIDLWADIEEELPGQAVFVQTLVSGALMDLRKPINTKTRKQVQDDARESARAATQLVDILKRTYSSPQALSYLRSHHDLVGILGEQLFPESRAEFSDGAWEIIQGHQRRMVCGLRGTTLIDVLEGFISEQESVASTAWEKPHPVTAAGSEGLRKTFMRLLARAFTDFYGRRHAGWILVFTRAAFNMPNLSESDVKGALRHAVW